jgi:protein translocase SecG subunit
MVQVIMAIHLMVVTALVILVLYQKSEGGALGMGGSGVFTGRGQANALTRATGILATIFFLTSIALTVIPAWQRRAEGGEDWTKAIDQGDIKFKEVKPGEKAPEPGKDSLFDQLQRAQQKRQQGGATTPAEAPRGEAPKAEAPPVTDAPKVESPAAEAPKAPAAEAPKAPAVETPSAPPPPTQWKSPGADAPKAEAPAAPAAEAPRAPAAEAPKAESAPSAPPPPTQWKSPAQ